VPVPEEVPDEGTMGAGFIRTNTINFKQPSNKESECSHKLKEPEEGPSRMSNINKVVDFYSFTFGK